MSNEPRIVSNGHLGSEIAEEKSFAVLIHALTVVQSFAYGSTGRFGCVAPSRRAAWPADGAGGITACGCWPCW